MDRSWNSRTLLLYSINIRYRVNHCSLLILYSSIVQTSIFFKETQWASISPYRVLWVAPFFLQDKMHRGGKGSWLRFLTSPAEENLLLWIICKWNSLLYALVFLQRTHCVEADMSIHLCVKLREIVSETYKMLETELGYIIWIIYLFKWAHTPYGVQ